MWSRKIAFSSLLSGIFTGNRDTGVPAWNNRCGDLRGYAGMEAKSIRAKAEYEAAVEEFAA
jgi:hypothetical protein